MIEALRIPRSKIALFAVVGWILLVGAAWADDPITIADKAQPDSKGSTVDTDSLQTGTRTAWGPWPARTDATKVRLQDRPTPLWEKAVLVPHFLVGLPFRFLHHATNASLIAMDDLGWFELPPREAHGFKLPGRVYALPTVAVSGLEGVTYGIAFTRPDLWGPENLAYMKASTSSRKAEKLAGGSYFKLCDRIDLQIGGGFAEMAKMLYYGLGPESDDADRSYYERDSWWGGTEVGLELGKGFRTDLLTFFSRVEAAETENESQRSLLRIHEGRLPYGFPGQSNGWTTRLGLLRDTTDENGRPSRGSFHKISVAYFHASDGTDLQYLRYHANAEHFFPLWLTGRTLGLRAFFNRIEETGTVDVPFSRLVTFSRPDELRGYRSMRFYGLGSLGVSGEYRWPVWVRHRRGSTGVDAYVFGDAGQVFNRREEISLPHFEITGGLGFRLIGADGSFLGQLELGFSEEETVISLSFGQNFQHDRRGLLYGKDPTRKR